MSGNGYNLHIDKLCCCLKLGDLIEEPQPISGGLLHKMFSIITTQGRYAVKALNPQIMLRPTAMGNYIDSEGIALLATKHIPALPAKRFNNQFMHAIDNQYYLVFDWINGKSLTISEIDSYHCEKIGRILADIHKTDFSELEIAKEKTETGQITDWNYYLKKGQENSYEWADLLQKNIDDLYKWNEMTVEAANSLSSDLVISHRDLDPKNVLWENGKPITIDWESAGYINPMQDLIETALYWSENQEGAFQKEKFSAFIKAYQETRPVEANWTTVLENGFRGKMEWLEYSMKRSLWLDCSDAEEQKMGTAQATGTLHAIMNYAEMIPMLEKWLSTVQV